MNAMQTVLENQEAPAIPQEVSLLCSALETGQYAATERRARRRRSYRTAAYLQLFADACGAQPVLIYTRDVEPRGVGFVTQRRLPLGYGGILEMQAPDGRVLRIHGTIIRCRPASPGWFEGSVSFNREQPDFLE